MGHHAPAQPLDDVPKPPPSKPRDRRLAIAEVAARSLATLLKQPPDSLAPIAQTAGKRRRRIHR